MCTTWITLCGHRTNRTLYVYILQRWHTQSFVKQIFKTILHRVQAKQSASGSSTLNTIQAVSITYFSSSVFPLKQIYWIRVVVRFIHFTFVLFHFWIVFFFINKKKYKHSNPFHFISFYALISFIIFNFYF